MSITFKQLQRALGRIDELTIDNSTGSQVKDLAVRGKSMTPYKPSPLSTAVKTGEKVIGSGTGEKVVQKALPNAASKVLPKIASGISTAAKIGSGVGLALTPSELGKDDTAADGAKYGNAMTPPKNKPLGQTNTSGMKLTGKTFDPVSTALNADSQQKIDSGNKTNQRVIGPMGGASSASSASKTSGSQSGKPSVKPSTPIQRKPLPQNKPVSSAPVQRKTLPKPVTKPVEKDPNAGGGFVTGRMGQGKQGQQTFSNVVRGMRSPTPTFQRSGTSPLDSKKPSGGKWISYKFLTKQTRKPSFNEWATEKESVLLRNFLLDSRIDEEYKERVFYELFDINEGYIYPPMMEYLREDDEVNPSITRPPGYVPQRVKDEQEAAKRKAEEDAKRQQTPTPTPTTPTAPEKTPTPTPDKPPVTKEPEPEKKPPSPDSPQMDWHSKEAIVAMQRRLNALGHNVRVDGIVGKETAGAVRELQRGLNAKGHNLAVDGDYGAQTHAATKSLVQKPTEKNPEDSPEKDEINDPGFVPQKPEEEKPKSPKETARDILTGKKPNEGKNGFLPLRPAKPGEGRKKPNEGKNGFLPLRPAKPGEGRMIPAFYKDNMPSPKPNTKYKDNMPSPKPSTKYKGL